VRSPAALGSASCVGGERLSSFSARLGGAGCRGLGFLRLVDGGGGVEAREPSSAGGAGAAPATRAAMGRVAGWSGASTRLGCWPSDAMSWVAVRCATDGFTGTEACCWLATGAGAGRELGVELALGAAAAGGRLAKLAVGVVPGLRP